MKKVLPMTVMIIIITIFLMFVGQVIAIQKTGQSTQSATPRIKSPKPFQPDIDGVIEEQEYPQKLALKKNSFIIYWKNDHEFLYMALKAKTIGWLAMGFDPTSRMKDIDMIFGWVEDEQTTLLDIY